jgi:hypothetical protein
MEPKVEEADSEVENTEPEVEARDSEVEDTDPEVEDTEPEVEVTDPGNVVDLFLLSKKALTELSEGIMSNKQRVHKTEI